MVLPYLLTFGRDFVSIMFMLVDNFIVDKADIWLAFWTEVALASLSSL